MAPSARYPSNLGQIIEYIPGTSASPRSLVLALRMPSSSTPHRYFLWPAMERRLCTPEPRVRWISLRTKLLRFRRPVLVLTIADRLYLAAYVDAPDESTLFPYPEPPRSPSKRSQRAVDGPVPAQRRLKQPHYFTVDDTLLYNAFHHDFGPLHIGHLYRFALQFHEILGAKDNKDRPVVFWSRADPRSMSPLRPPHKP